MKEEIDIRSIKIQPFYRPTAWREAKIVPSLFLCGNWLEEVGFKPGDQVRITVQDGLLIIQKEKVNGRK